TIQRNLTPLVESGRKYIQQTELVTKLAYDNNKLAWEMEGQLKKLRSEMSIVTIEMESKFFQPKAKAQDEAKLKALRDSYNASQNAISNSQSQLARAQKEIAQHRYNHIVSEPEIYSNIQKSNHGDTDISYTAATIHFQNFGKEIAVNRSIAQTAVFYKDLNVGSVATGSVNDAINLTKRLKETKSINQQEFNIVFYKLIKDVTSFHKLRLKILDSTPGLVHSLSSPPSAPSSSSSSFQQVLPMTNFYFPTNIPKLKRLFGFDLSVREFIGLQLKPVTVGQIAECLGVVLEDVEVDVVLECLDLGVSEGEGGSSVDGDGVSRLRLNDDGFGVDGGELPAYSESG
ncbi:hypothetical protein HDU76_002770, partial [Blyttiomyces sp. JEL0837]